MGDLRQQTGDVLGQAQAMQEIVVEVELKFQLYLKLKLVVGGWCVQMVITETFE